jgi:hypothetical protein
MTLDLNKGQTAMEVTMKALRLLVPVVVVLGLACASAGQTGQQSGRLRNVIAAEELSGMMDQNAYDAIRRLRPQWLTTRGSAIVVFVESVRAGAVDHLRTIALTDVAELRYISASDATTRFGTGYPGGVIQVIMK